MPISSARIPDTYTKQSNFTINAVRLRDQITSRARTVLLVLLAASGLVFIVACSNVANLILARTTRREGELAIRAALGASPRALRRTLLAESVLLCGIGAALGVVSAQPMVSVLARYASRFSIRALDLTVDASILWVGAGLAIAAAVLLAYVPRLPSPDTSHGASVADRQRADHRPDDGPPAAVRGHADRGLVHAPRRRRHARQDAACAAGRRKRVRHAQRPCAGRPDHGRGPDTRSDPRVLSRHAGTDQDVAGREQRGDWRCGAVARRWQRRAGVPVHRRRVRDAPTAKRIRAPSSARCRPASSPR